MNVLIVPLFPRQFEWLKAEYKGPHDIEYLDSAKGESPLVLESKAKRADKVVVLTKFISHSHWDKVPREKLIHSDSVNIDRLVNILEAIPDEPSAPVVAREPKTFVRPRAQLLKKIDMSISTTREVDGFVLTTAVPLPDRTKNLRPNTPAYPLDKMEIGESFWVEAKDKKEQQVIAGRISVAANYQRKKNPALRFKTSVRQEGGVRCWRAPDRTPEQIEEDKLKAVRQPKKKKK